MNGTEIDSFEDLKPGLFVFATPLGSGAGISLGGGNEIYLYGVTIDAFAASDVSFF